MTNCHHQMYQRRQKVVAVAVIGVNLILAQNNRKSEYSPSGFSGVMVVVEVGASARKLGQNKPHPTIWSPLIIS